MGAATIPRHVVATNAQTSHRLYNRGVQPIMQWDCNTISTCTYWYNNFEGLTCKEVRDWMYAISPADFSRWNPSITLDCGNWQALAYCVEVQSEQTSSIPSSTASATSRTSTTTPAATRRPELLGWAPLGCYVDDRTLYNHTTKAGGDRLTVTPVRGRLFFGQLRVRRRQGRPGLLVWGFCGQLVDREPKGLQHPLPWGRCPDLRRRQRLQHL